MYYEKFCNFERLKFFKMIFGVSLSFESQNRISSIPLIVECGNSCNGVFCFDCGVFVWI